jgi:hypothetical protein
LICSIVSGVHERLALVGGGRDVEIGGRGEGSKGGDREPQERIRRPRVVIGRMGCAGGRVEGREIGGCTAAGPQGGQWCPRDKADVQTTTTTTKVFVSNMKGCPSWR